MPVTPEEIKKYSNTNLLDCVICGAETNCDYNGAPMCINCIGKIYDSEDAGEIQPDKSIESRLSLIAHKYMSFDDIRNLISLEFKVSPSDIDLNTRKKEIVFARQMCMTCARLAMGKTYKKIALEYGNKDHSTVIDSIKAIINLHDTNKKYREDISGIMIKLNIYDKFLNLKR